MKIMLRKGLAFIMTVIMVLGGLQIGTSVQAEEASKLANQVTSKLSNQEPTKLTNQDITNMQNTSTDSNYEEENVSLPTLHSDESVLGMSCNSKGYCEIYTGTGEEKENCYKTYSKYVQNEKKEWAVSEIKWSNTFGDNPDIYPTQFQYSKNGNLYCIAADNKDKHTPALVKIGTDGSVREIKLPAMTELTQERSINITSYVVTDNNIFIFSSGYSSIFGIDMQTGNLLYTINEHSPVNLNAVSDHFYIEDYKENKIIDYNIYSGRIMNSYALTYEDGNKFDLLLQGKPINSHLLTDSNYLYYVSTGGIYQYCNDKVTCLVEGYANLLSQPSKNLNTYAALGIAHDFYVLGYNVDQTYQLTRYSIKKFVSNDYQGDFTIAMYQKNERVMEAVALYAQKHPKIKVSCEYISKDSDLETQKKQCEASDVVVCDNGEYSKLRKYHILKDLSTTANSLISSEGLYGNLIHPFYENGNLYVMPVEFSANIFAGDKELLDSAGSILSLANYSKKNRKKVWQGLGYESLGFVLYSAYNKQLIKDNTEWNETNLRHLLKSLKSTSQIIDDYMFMDYCVDIPSSFQLNCYANYSIYNDSLLYTSIDQKSQLSVLLALLSLKGGEYRDNSTFKANCLVGINKKTDDINAEEFLKLLYGADAQNVAIGNSIPLRSNSLMDWTDGSSDHTVKVNEENWDKGINLTKKDVINFQNMLSKLTTYENYDEKQCRALRQALGLYMTGYRNLDDTVKRILSNKVYQPSYSSLSLDTSKELNILFIGNSLTKSWHIPEQFEKMAKLSGKKVKVNTMVYDGYSLSEHLLIMKDDRLKMLQEADVVIFQEGGKSGNTLEAILKMMNMASKDAKFFYYITNGEASPNHLVERDIGQIDNISFIPAGYVHEQLIDDGIYKYEDLHLPNDAHQNALYAFIVAETMYATIFDLDMSRIAYPDFASYLRDSLKSNYLDDRKAEIVKTQDVIKEVFEKY